MNRIPGISWATAAIIDSQSVKTTQVGGLAIGYDGGKQVKGRKRFILVDVQGLILAVKVVAAGISEKAGAILLLNHIRTSKPLYKLCRKIRLVWADGGYQGSQLAAWVSHTLGWLWQVVKRNESIAGFQLLPKRWIVERTDLLRVQHRLHAWLSFNRRLAKDYERLPQNSESMIYLAMIPNRPLA